MIRRRPPANRLALQIANKPQWEFKHQVDQPRMATARSNRPGQALGFDGAGRPLGLWRLVACCGAKIHSTGAGFWGRRQDPGEESMNQDQGVVVRGRRVSAHSV
jgi:hypothetical protein